MRGFSAALFVLAAIAADNVSAFTPNNLLRPDGRMTQRRMTVDMSTETDVSIPYDAAARLAYDEWREQFGKGAFDEVRYNQFKENYESITVSNVIAKKKAREEGDESPFLLALNEYGDFSTSEYEAMMNGETPSTDEVVSTGDVLGKAVEAAESQSEASSALQEAADALAEEEEVCLIGLEIYIYTLLDSPILLVVGIMISRLFDSFVLYTLICSFCNFKFFSKFLFICRNWLLNWDLTALRSLKLPLILWKELLKMVVKLRISPVRPVLGRHTSTGARNTANNPTNLDSLLFLPTILKWRYSPLKLEKKWRLMNTLTVLKKSTRN